MSCVAIVLSPRSLRQTHSNQSATEVAALLFASHPLRNVTVSIERASYGASVLLHRRTRSDDERWSTAARRVLVHIPTFCFKIAVILFRRALVYSEPFYCTVATTASRLIHPLLRATSCLLLPRSFAPQRRPCPPVLSCSGSRPPQFILRAVYFAI